MIDPATAAAGIGGVMPAGLTAGPHAKSVLAAWQANLPYLAAFATARSALAALLVDRGAKRIWLPAYICRAVADAAKVAAVEIRFYGHDPALVADTGALAGGLAGGDAVLGVDYFGFPSAEFVGLRRRFDDVLWIEDRAQALDAGEAWGEALLFSPRKLIGVADGGLLVSSRRLPTPTVAGGTDRWAPEDARAEDPEGLNPGSWYPLFRQREDRLGIDRTAATARTMTVLAATPLEPAVSARRANWRLLAEMLGDYAFWPRSEATTPPLAFPILVGDAQAAQQALANERIWAPRHWAELPGEDFPLSQRLARHLLSLPVDQRYGAGDMSRMAEAVRRLARPQPR